MMFVPSQLVNNRFLIILSRS